MNLDLVQLYRNLKTINPQDYHPGSWRKCLIGQAITHGFIEGHYWTSIDNDNLRGIVMTPEGRSYPISDHVRVLLSSNKVYEFFSVGSIAETWKEALDKFACFLITNCYVPNREVLDAGVQTSVEPMTKLSEKMELLTKIIKMLEDNGITDFKLSTIVNRPKIEITI